MNRSLAMMLVLTLPLGVLADEAAKEAPEAKDNTFKLNDQQKAAVKNLEKAGAQVLELAQNDSRLTVAFHLANGKINDQSLAALKGLTVVCQLNLRGTEVSDAGLAHLSGATGLTRLHLEKTKVTDIGLEHLQGLSNLEYLNV